jgi:3-oxoacyl-[acyl-carrier-protein] synthase II
MDVVVTGIGLASVLGDLTVSWQALLAGQSGIRVRPPFWAWPAQPLGMMAQAPASLLTLTERVVLAAVQDAGLTLPLPDCGVVVGSSRGQQAQWELLAHQFYSGDRAALPATDWLATFPNGAALTTARLLQTHAPVGSPMAACATGLWAIAQGVDLIRSGTCQRVIAGAVEAPITPLSLTGFARMGALATTGAYPFDRHRNGLVLAEGGAVLVMEAAALARSRAANIYGQVGGFGLTADGYHVSAPEVGSRAALVAIQQSLARSGLAPEQIDYIHAHGTATQLNDRNEAHLMQTLFPHGVAISSTKGATGHTLGASAALGVAFCLMALKHQHLPPCVGLTQPEFALDLLRTARSTQVNTALCLGFGFGGQNGAIVLKRHETGAPHTITSATEPP